MSKRFIPLLLLAVAFAMLAWAQDTSSSGNAKLLLNFQRTSAYMESDSAAPHAQGMEGLTSRNPGSTTHYPTTNECISIYADGSYSFERVEEKSYGKPKVRVYKGTLAAPQLAKLQSITGDEGFRKIVITEMPEPPENATGVREGEVIQTTVLRDDGPQAFTLAKRRFATSDPSGIDKYTSNWEKVEKPLKPFLSLMKDIEKEGQSRGKEGAASCQMTQQPI